MNVSKLVIAVFSSALAFSAFALDNKDSKDKLLVVKKEKSHVGHKIGHQGKTSVTVEHTGHTKGKH